MEKKADQLTDRIKFINADCMDIMAQYPDKYFDLAIVDPPYGVGQHFNFRYGNGDQVYENNAPSNLYFLELTRITVNAIIWGGNYFSYALPVSRCWLCWQKQNPLESFSDFELAWTNFDRVSKNITLKSYGFNHADKRMGERETIHPTQKPVALYEWIYHNYAKPEFKILDTHLGSGSNAIAAHNFGIAEFVGIELDSEYYADSIKRFNRVTSQLRMF